MKNKLNKLKVLKLHLIILLKDEMNKEHNNEKDTNYRR